MCIRGQVRDLGQNIQIQQQCRRALGKPLNGHPSSTGFGTKYSDPATLPTGLGSGLDITTTNTQLVASQGSVSPYVYAYDISSSGFGSKYSNPSTLPTAAVGGITLNSNDTAVIVNQATTPIAYAWSGSGFGSKYSDPSTSTGTGPTQVSMFSNDSVVFCSWTGSSPYVRAYAWTNAGGWGSAYSDPSSLPVTAGYNVASYN